MQQFRIRADLTYRSFAGCAIVLDVERDRYWRVDAETAGALDILCGRSAGRIDPARLGELHSLQLVEPDDGAPRAYHPELPAPDASALESADTAAHSSRGDLFEVAWHSARARNQIRRQRLGIILSAIRNRRADGRIMPCGNEMMLSRRFKRARRMIPLANQCLPDTLAFLAFMARRGQYPNLVFGVEAYPFAAHCWAQSASVVLNDALDHARRFAPILAV